MITLNIRLQKVFTAIASSVFKILGENNKKKKKKRKGKKDKNSGNANAQSTQPCAVSDYNTDDVILCPRLESTPTCPH